MLPSAIEGLGMSALVANSRQSVERERAHIERALERHNIAARLIPGETTAPVV